MNQQHTPEKDLIELEDLLLLSNKAALDRYNTIRISNPGLEVKQIQNPSFTDEGIGTKNVFNFFTQNVIPHLHAGAGPRYLGFVTGGSTPASILGDFLTTIFDQNTFGAHDSAAPILEKQALSYLKEMLGLSTNYFGTFVTGATQSNFVSLATARQWCGKQLGVDISKNGLSTTSIKIVGATLHASAYKSISMLGLGKNNVDVIPTIPERESMNILALENYLKENQKHSIIVIASAGTVNTGDFDDLIAIKKLKEKFSFWLHVDAAFGAFAAVSPKYSRYMQGIDAADSITVDAHKWLNVPYDCAMQFTLHPDLQAEVFQNSAAYLPTTSQSEEFFHYTPENSRRWRGLPTWFTLLAYGKNGVRNIVESNCSLAWQLGEWIKKSDRYELLSEVHLNIVCFTFKKETDKEKIQMWLNEVRDDGRVFFTPTNYKGKQAIRAAFSNWMTNEEDLRIIEKTLEKWQ